MPPSPIVSSDFESQPLLRILAIATEQQMQLGPLLQAFAKDQRGGQRWRVARLAELIDEGSSLPAALEQVPRVLPREDVLAIRCGAQSGTLAATLRALVNSSSVARLHLQRRIQSTFMYVVIVLLVLAGIISVVMTKIFPAYLLMLSDYETAGPAVLYLFVDVAKQRAIYWYAFLLIVLVLSWCLWTGWPGRSLRSGLLGRLLPWLDTRSADLLQNLSIVTHAGRPIPGALSTLARYHHDPSLRRKLLFVRNEVEQGADLWGAMRHVGLLTAPDVELIKTSDRVGNRAWALEQLALRQRRRVQRRLEFLSELIQPTAILLLGLLVLAFSWAAYGPLISLIMNLT